MDEAAKATGTEPWEKPKHKHVHYLLQLPFKASTPTIMPVMNNECTRDSSKDIRATAESDWWAPEAKADFRSEPFH